VATATITKHEEEGDKRLDGLVGERLRELAGEVEADLAHRREDRGAEAVGGLGAGGAHDDGPPAEVIAEGGGHLRAAGVVDTDVQHLRALYGSTSLSSNGATVGMLTTG